MSTVLRSIRAAYRTQAVVDWLALEIETARRTQFRWLQGALVDYFGGARPYVEPVDPDASGTATRFLIRLNDAQCRDFDTISAALLVLDQQYGQVGPAIIKGLEVSLDFYPNDDKAYADLLSLVDRLQMSLEARYGRNHRLVGVRAGGKRARADLLDSTSKPDPQQTLYINNKHDPLSWRVYHKITDQKRNLPRDQHRARVEFTLQGAGLDEYGIYTLDDLAALDFRDFSELLHFRQFIPMPELIAGMRPELAQLVQHATRRDRNMIALYPFGLHAYYRDSRTGKPRNGGRFKQREHSTHTESDDELNHLARDRLRDLTRRFTHKIRTKNRRVDLGSHRETAGKSY